MRAVLGALDCRGALPLAMTGIVLCIRSGFFLMVREFPFVIARSAATKQSRVVLLGICIWP